jgi:hypothetical protein
LHLVDLILSVLVCLCRKIFVFYAAKPFKNGVSETCMGDISSSLASSSIGGLLPMDVGDDGQTPIGELRVSGVVGSVN